MPFALKSGLALGPVFGFLLFSVGCKPNNSPLPSQEVKNVTPEPRDASRSQRFMPTGGNPEIALDTSSGSLCRTIEPTPEATDKYAKLPMCGAESLSPAVQAVFVWDKALKEAPLSASCYQAKSLLPSYSATTPPTMRVTSNCIITNLTAKPEPLAGAVSYSAILRRPDGETTRRAHVSLASSESVVPAHGHIEGGLWLNTDCAPKQSPAECLRTWLGNSTELILTAETTGPKAHITMDRDSDPLGILK
jgi:hypothetical protein